MASYPRTARVLASLIIPLLLLTPALGAQASDTALGAHATGRTPSQAVALGKDDQIKDLAKAGKLTLQMIGTVLNCPIVKMLGHGS